MVYKTSEAWQPDGAIGGLIELHTAEPFDFGGPKAIAKLSASTGSQSSRIEPSEFLLLSNTFDDNRFATPVSIGQQEQDTTACQIDSGGWWQMPVNSAGGADGDLAEGRADGTADHGADAR